VISTSYIFKVKLDTIAAPIFTLNTPWNFINYLSIFPNAVHDRDEHHLCLIVPPLDVSTSVGNIVQHKYSSLESGDHIRLLKIQKSGLKDSDDKSGPPSAQCWAGSISGSIWAFAQVVYLPESGLFR
jgi:hypothetical protein